MASAPASSTDTRTPFPGAPSGPMFDATSFLDEEGFENPRSRLLNPYYAIKPLMPREAQLVLRRVYARRQLRRRFPAWPIEALLVDRLRERFRAELQGTGAGRVPFINFWPERKRFAFVLTHDVEDTVGAENIPRMLEIERRHGVRSSWNFVADDYPIDPGLFAAIREAGCEIGLHGLHHDGLLFSDRASFEAQLPRIRSVMREWGAVGFRSPATHREAAWMHELNCLYDSSFPDTDPFEPQPGGCCSIWPYFLGDMVELPITMAQDHTLFEILREISIRRWIEKSDWLASNHGLVNVIVHPDYMLSDRRLDLYEQLLDHLTGLSEGWHALPRDLARWWLLRCRLERGEPAPAAPPAAAGPGFRATTAHAREEGGEIVFDL